MLGQRGLDAQRDGVAFDNTNYQSLLLVTVAIPANRRLKQVRPRKLLLLTHARERVD